MPRVPLMHMELEVSRPYEERDIQIQQTQERRTAVSEIDKRIKKNLEDLEKEIVRARSQGIRVVLYDSELSTVRRIEESGGRLVVETGVTSYKELLGMRPADEVLQKFEREHVTNTSTVGTVSELADDKIPLTVREDYMFGIAANSLGQELPVYQVPAGFVKPSDSSDPRKAVRRHISEDLFNAPDNKSFQLKSNRLLGVTYCPTMDEVYFCFHSRLFEKSHELKPRGKIYFVDNSRTAIRDFLRKPPNSWSVLGYSRSILLMHLTHNWGENELDKIRRLY